MLRWEEFPEDSTNTVREQVNDWIEGLQTQGTIPKIKFLIPNNQSFATVEIPIRLLLQRTSYFDLLIKAVLDASTACSEIPMPLLGESWNIASDFFATMTENRNVDDLEPETADFGVRYGFIGSTCQSSDDEPIPFAVSDDEPMSLPLVADHSDVANESHDQSAKEVDVTQLNPMASHVDYLGHRYRKKRSDSHGGSYYKCANAGCKAGIYVGQNGAPVYLGDHICGPDQSAKDDTADVIITAEHWKRFVSTFEERVREKSSEDLWKIVSDMCDESEDLFLTICCNSMTAISNIFESLMPARSKQRSDSPFDELELEHKFIRVHIVGECPIIIMATDFMIERAAVVDWILIDGTFKAAPRGFKQILTIVGEDIQTGRFMPMVYILLADKAQKTYEYAFSMLAIHIKFPLVTHVTCDYESALKSTVMKWIRETNPQVRFIGCRFHYSQCIRKYIISTYGKRLTEAQQEILYVFTNFGFLTRSEIDTCLLELGNRNHGMSQFIKYFVKTWLPKFDDWNVSACPTYMQKRATNNAIESLNGKMGSRFGKHPTMSRLVKGLLSMSIKKENEVKAGWQANPLKSVIPDKREILARFRELVYSLPVEGSIAKQIEEWSKKSNEK